MKSIKILNGMLFLALLYSFTFSTTTETITTSPDYVKKDFVNTVINKDLETRFETQFSNLIPEVTKVDVHYNETNGYYYAVYGVDLEGAPVVDYFKTTKEEVVNQEYNYILMNERTTNAARICREATTFPFPFDFCHLNNTGHICGIEVWPGVCRFY